MLHSVSDLDTYVKEFQAERQREADRARRIEEATRGNGHTPDPLALGLAQLARRTKSWLSYLVAGKDAQPGCAESASEPAVSAGEAPVAAHARRRSTEPYNGMVVVARGVRETVARK